MAKNRPSNSFSGLAFGEGISNSTFISPEPAAVPEETIVSDVQKKAVGRPKSSKETKKCASLALLPSVHSQMMKIAYMQRKSLSDITGELFQAYIDEYSYLLDEYDNL